MQLCETQCNAKTWFHDWRTYKSCCVNTCSHLIRSNTGFDFQHNQYLRLQKWQICRKHTFHPPVFPSKTSTVRRAFYNQSVIFFLCQPTMAMPDWFRHMPADVPCFGKLENVWKMSGQGVEHICWTCLTCLEFATFLCVFHRRGFGTRRCVPSLHAAKLYNPEVAME